ncbi:hypothetical protein [Pseudozobellia thermophila]|uniref:hypothetical protein n=1 Tax=Pseudozobellia thermophila TaxID=192903 RepID=UPI00111481C0|nr:hypothetical protein [Pseudozobellia thermophila]
MKLPPIPINRFIKTLKIRGEIVLLNLLKFKQTADYTDLQHLRPEQEVEGKEAYKLYLYSTIPQLQKTGGIIVYYGKGKDLSIGPATEKIGCHFIGQTPIGNEVYGICTK